MNDLRHTMIIEPAEPVARRRGSEKPLVVKRLGVLMKYLLTFLAAVLLTGCASHSQQQPVAVVHSECSPASLPCHHVAVVVTTNAAVVYVGGEVVQPGRITWTPQLTLTKAVALAGGFTDFADRKQIEIRHRDGKVEKCSYEQAEGKVTNNPVLERGDFVRVPQRLF